MPRIQLIATKLKTYAGKRLVPGDTFSATASDARVLVAARLAVKADTSKPSTTTPPAAPEPDPVVIAPAQTYETTEMIAVSQSQPEDVIHDAPSVSDAVDAETPVKRRRRRTYQRTDLTAEP